MALDTFVALLRGINVGGQNRIPMVELRSLCTRNGWTEVRSYIQSGNLVLRADGAGADVEATLERSIEERFGFAVPVVARSAAEWTSYLTSNPFREAAEGEAKLVMLGLAKAAPQPDAVERLLARATGGERIRQVGDAFWIHYASGGVARSRIAPGLLDRIIGSPVTTRNWRTVVKLAELAGEGSER